MGVVCRAIPAGRVATYGQIALLCGKPQCPRQVGTVLGRGAGGEVPAHRVVNRQGYLSGAKSFLGPDIQRLSLEAEGVALPCEVNVLITGNEGIHAINLAQREVDAPTDVLSFPMLELTPGDKPTEEDMEPGSGRVPLGDMVLNIDRIRSQGEEYGHGFRREAAYLAVHSVLHLLGYDHMDEGPMKKQMRSREEAILAQLDITRG